MINKKLLERSVQDFIYTQRKLDAATLVLKGSPFRNIPVKELAQQLQAKRKAEKKLPTWFANRHILYPPSINLSQSSSEVTANYKANLVSGGTLVDITGGFGVDDFYFSKRMEQVIHCELNEELSELAAHNFQALSTQNNIDFHVGDGIQFINNLTKSVDWLYVDPGRRASSGQKLYHLEDTHPNILPYLKEWRAKTDYILLKTSPLFDLKQGIKSLETVQEIHILAIKNDVKELLWVIGKKTTPSIAIKTINFKNSDIEKFKGTFAIEEQTAISYSSPLTYLYEPNAAILKAGFFKSIAKAYNLHKLAPNSHLYTADRLINFPGRTFKIKACLPVHKKKIQATGIKKANISIRNFPMQISALKKKFKLKDGGSDYFFFTQDYVDKKILIWARKQ